MKPGVKVLEGAERMALIMFVHDHIIHTRTDWQFNAIIPTLNRYLLETGQTPLTEEEVKIIMKVMMLVSMNHRLVNQLLGVAKE